MAAENAIFDQINAALVSIRNFQTQTPNFGTVENWCIKNHVNTLHTEMMKLSTFLSQ